MVMRLCAMPCRKQINASSWTYVHLISI